MIRNKIKTNDVASFLKGKKVIETSTDPVVFSAKQTINLVLDSGDRVSIYGDNIEFSILTKDQIADILNFIK